MASTAQALRDELQTRLSLKKAASGFINNDFDIATGWFEYDLMEELPNDHPNGLVYILGMVADSEVNKSRTNVSMKEVPVMVGFKRVINDPTNNDLIDVLEELVEQFTDVARLEVDLDGYSWTRTEFMKDEAGMPLGFQSLQQGMFAAWFTTYFNFVLQPAT